MKLDKVSQGYVFFSVRIKAYWVRITRELLKEKSFFRFHRCLRTRLPHGTCPLYNTEVDNQTDLYGAE
jgi:hypothetical protein